MLPLYKSLIRPHLEYCCPIWNPYYKKDIKLVEGAQRRATKLVPGLSHLKYDDRLEALGLVRLERRRVRGDLIETYKILHGNYDIPVEKFFEFNETSRRGHKLKLFKKRFRLDVKKYGFSSRVVDDWNNLSECCVNSVSINCFKKHISLDPEPGTV